MPQETKTITDVQPGNSSTSQTQNLKGASSAHSTRQEPPKSLDAKVADAKDIDSLVDSIVGTEQSSAQESAAPGDVQKLNITDKEEKEEGQEESTHSTDKEQEEEKDGEEEQEEGQEGEEEKGEKPEGETDEEEDKGEEVDKELSRFDKHPRFVELNQKVKDLQPRAERYDQLQAFLTANGISEAEHVELLQFRQVLVQDPIQALERLTPIYNALKQLAGEGGEFDKDIKDRLDAGKIDEDSAKELQKTRAMSQRNTRIAQQQSVQAQQQQVSTALLQWETAKKSSDPDYKEKVKMINQVFTAKRAMDPQATPAKCIQYAEEAWREVTDFVRARAPKPPLVKRPLQNGSRVQRKAEPKNVDEYIEQLVETTVGAHRS